MAVVLGLASGRMSRRVWWAATVAVAAVAAVAVTVWYQGDRGEPPAVAGRGDAPLFDLENVQPGEPRVRLVDYSGEPVVVNFWASWCVPCRREMPTLAAAHAELREQVAFLGVNHQDDRDAALALLAETDIQYPSGYDPQGDTAYGYGLFGMPTTVFIGPDGQVLEQHTGELSTAALSEALDRLFDIDTRRS